MSPDAGIYTIYLPASNLILRVGHGHFGPFVGYSVVTSYALADCEGTAYLRSDFPEPSTKQFILHRNGTDKFFVQTGATTTIDELSFTTGGGCNNVATN